MKFSIRLIFLCSVCLLPPSVLSQTPSEKQLKTVLNSKSYTLITPAESWIYAGGLIVADSHGASFVELPTGVNQPTATNDAKADFPAEVQSKKFTLGALLTGFVSLLGGNPGANFGHSSSTTVKEISASGSRITFGQAQDLIAIDSLQNEVRGWLTQSPPLQVFMVQTVLTTKALNVTQSSSTELDLSFNGGKVTKCQTTSAQSSSSSTSGKSSKTSGGTGTSTATTPNSSSSSTTPSQSGSSQQSTAPSGSTNTSTSTTPSTSTGPGGQLQLCINDDSSLSMNSSSDLAFAVLARKAALDKNNKAALQPAYDIPPNGFAENDTAKESKNPDSDPKSVAIANRIPSTLTKLSWTEAQSQYGKNAAH